jgi:hypothetical protein
MCESVNPADRCAPADFFVAARTFHLTPMGVFKRWWRGERFDQLEELNQIIV